MNHFRIFWMLLPFIMLCVCEKTVVAASSSSPAKQGTKTPIPPTNPPTNLTANTPAIPPVGPVDNQTTPEIPPVPSVSSSDASAIPAKTAASTTPAKTIPTKRSAVSSLSSSSSLSGTPPTPSFWNSVYALGKSIQPQQTRSIRERVQCSIHDGSFTDQYSTSTQQCAALAESLEHVAQKISDERKNNDRIAQATDFANYVVKNKIPVMPHAATKLALELDILVAEALATRNTLLSIHPDVLKEFNSRTGQSLAITDIAPSE